MPRDMSSLYTKRTFPYQEGETNRLTERLTAQGADPANSKTWPKEVYSIDGKNFLWRHEWIYTRDWEAPCGLMHRGHGQSWGDCYIKGEYHCTENDNPLFRCPCPERACPHRLQLPPGINCEFHPAGREYDPSQEIDSIEREKLNRKWSAFLKDAANHPGYDNPCFNLDDDGKVRWRLYNCDTCKNTCCIARNWAARDISPANIYYDLYTETVDETGLVPWVRKELRKGLKVFEKPHARTDCEMALAIWKADPEHPFLPFGMRKLNAYTGRDYDSMRLLMRRVYNHERITVTVEIRNIYVAKNEQKDLIADLEAVRDGAEVIHESDLQKAAAQAKTDRRREAEIEKTAKVYANYAKRGKAAGFFAMHGHADDAGDKPAIRQKNAEFRKAVRKRAEEILEKEAQKQRKATEKAMQMSLFDEMKG